MRFLSIQSGVAYGYVGNMAVTFPLQRRGHEVFPVFTVVYSNHTGYGNWRGPILPAEQVGEIITGIEDRDVFETVDGVLTGYQGAVEIGDVIVDAVKRVKKANPKAIYTCDPVMGNAVSGCFVKPEIPVMLREQVVPIADILTPNQFELGFITGTDPKTLAETLEAADQVRASGPELVLVTSVAGDDPDDQTIGLLAVSGRGAWQVRTPRLPIKANGSGDMAASLFTAHLLETGGLAEGDIPAALQNTASTIFSVLERTIESGERELRLIASQDQIADPEQRFEVTKVR